MSETKLSQPTDMPKCLVSDDEPDTNWLQVDETGWYDGLATFPSEEAARRVAAAWNAVAGIPTEALESGALGALITAAEHQRDTPPGAQPQLLAALRSLGRLK